MVCGLDKSSANYSIIADISSTSIGGKTSYFVISKSKVGRSPQESTLWVRKIITKYPFTEEVSANVEELCASMETWMARLDGHASITSRSDSRLDEGADDHNCRK